MEILKFTLSGRSAIFTRPGVNTVIMSYPHIHRVALLGLLGAIIGIEKDPENKWAKKDDKKELPPFYKELGDIQIAIIPKEINFSKEEMTITETTGFCNAGGNLVNHYGELVNPSWDIYVIKNDNKNYEVIKKYLINRDSHFLPYLGRNHNFADISNVEVLEGTIIEKTNRIDSFFVDKKVQYGKDEDDFMDERIFFSDSMPVAIDEVFLEYKVKTLTLTNDEIIKCSSELIKVKDKIIFPLF